MFKINERTFSRLSKTTQGCIIVSAFKEYQKEVGENADIGMFKDSKGCMFVCLDRMDGIIDESEKLYHFSDFTQVYKNGGWEWQIKEQR